MRHQDIKVGMLLKLKKERQEAYAMPTNLVQVTNIKPRPGYKVPWIVSYGSFYKPQDFASILTTTTVPLRTY